MNIRKTLLEMDKATFNKYDLTHLYESCDLSDKDKQIVVDMLNKHEDAEVIYDNLKKYLSHDNIADDIDSITEDYDSKYTKVISKTVMDSDGFYTEYTWYRDEDGNNVFVFGDPDIYKPEDGDFDFETESNAVAVEWFDDYRGFEDDNDELIEKCKSLKEELPKEHLTIKLSGDTNVFVDERSITDIHEIRKAFLSEFGNTFINNNKQLQDKLMSEVIRVTERIIPEATLELETIDVVDGYAVIDMEVGFVEDKAFEKLTEELSNIIFNWYEGDHLTMEFDINECEINYNDLEEGTVKTRKGKWVNKGKAGTHGTFNTKKEADAQRKAMFASGYKGESLKENVYVDDSTKKQLIKQAEKVSNDIIKDAWISDQFVKNKGTRIVLNIPIAKDIDSARATKAENRAMKIYDTNDVWWDDFVLQVDVTDWFEDNKVKESVKTNEASYGGAYDIADDEYFTKEDGMEAAEEVISILEKEFPELKLEISDMALDNHSLYVVLVDEDGNEFTEEVVIDMRKIRHPLDLIKKYSPILAELFTKEIKEFHNDLNESASKFDLSKLKTEIKDKVKEVMTSPDFAFDSDDVDDLTYYYDDEIFEEPGPDPRKDFDCEGQEFTWVKRHGDVIHIDFDNWAVWEAYCHDDAKSYYFVVDEDTGFIDWGPIETLEEAQEFLQSKLNDEEDDEPLIMDEAWEPKFSDEWKPEDIELWKSIDWKARNYKPYIDETKKIKGEVKAVGLPGGTRTGEAIFAKEFSANPIYAPKWKPITDPFEGQGTNGWYMYDGVDADDGYMMMTRTETQEVSDALSH